MVMLYFLVCAVQICLCLSLCNANHKSKALVLTWAKCAIYVFANAVVKYAL